MDARNVRALRRSLCLALVLPVRCRSRSGGLDRVVIPDISIKSCRIDRLAPVLRIGGMVVVQGGAA